MGQIASGYKLVRVNQTPAPAVTEDGLYYKGELPPRPKVRVSEKTFRAITTYALEAAAHLVSPPKQRGENNEFECDDVARAIRDLRLQL